MKGFSQITNKFLYNFQRRENSLKKIEQTSEYLFYEIIKIVFSIKAPGEIFSWSEVMPRTLIRKIIEFRYFPLKIYIYVWNFRDLHSKWNIFSEYKSRIFYVFFIYFIGLFTDAIVTADPWSWDL